jgi:hypothetical protein
MAANSPFLKPLGIAAGVLGSVSNKNNVAFTCLKHLAISTVQVANSVKCKLFLLYRFSVHSTVPHLTSAPDYLEATEHVI